MKASEFRIGNYAKNENGNIVEMCATRIKAFSEGIIKYDPIELTEEWLLKFGFEYINGYAWGICWGVFNLKTKFYQYNSIVIKIEYVHQLQNLFYALSNKELNIKLPID